MSAPKNFGRDCTQIIPLVAIQRRPQPCIIGRLYLSWVLTAIGGIGVVVLFVSLFPDLGNLYEAMQDTLLLLLPATGYQLGKVNGFFLPRPH